MKRASRYAAAAATPKLANIAQVKPGPPSSWNNRMATMAGANPPVTTSAKLSSCTPSAPSTPNFRAAQPSKASHNMAKIHTAATIWVARAMSAPAESHNNAWPKNSPDAAAQHTTAPPSKLPRVNALVTQLKLFMTPKVGHPPTP